MEATEKKGGISNALRVSTRAWEWAGAVLELRKSDDTRTAVVREALDLGLLLLLASSPKGEDGKYGGVDPDWLIQRLRPYVTGTLAMMVEQGASIALTIGQPGVSYHHPVVEQNTSSLDTTMGDELSGLGIGVLE